MVTPVYIKPLLAILVIAAIASITAVLLRDSSGGPAAVRSASQQLPQNIDVALKKARFSEIQGGLLVWELIAERVDYDKSGDTAYLEAIRMEFQRTGSHGTVTVTADRGEYLSSAKKVRLNGHVHVVTEDGASFKTGSILYTGANAQFSTPDPVVFQQQRLQLAAVGMDLDVNNQRARFYSSVDAVITQN
jgi:LPS export ABC transporter protein LptC